MFDLLADSYETNNLSGNPAHAVTQSALLSDFAGMVRETGLSPWFAGPAFSGGTLQVRLTGGMGPRHRVESSTNLQSWSPVTEVKMTANEFSLSLTNAGRHPNFIRTRMISDD